MKNRQTKVIMLILIGLVLFSSSLALLLYMQQGKQNTAVHKSVMVTAYVSAKDIKKGELIDAHALKKALLPKEYAPAKLLLPQEIIGRYAITDIYKNEPIRREKIALVMPKERNATQPQNLQKHKTAKKQLQPKEDTITIPISAFRNIDPSLKAGEKIDIVSIENTKKGRDIDFQAKYIALNVTIKKFIVAGKASRHYVGKNSDGQNVTAQDIVLAISPKEIKNFLTLYYKSLELNAQRVYNANGNKGHLWVIRCSEEQDPIQQKRKEQMLADYKKTLKHIKRKAKKEKVSISYEQ